MSYLPYKITAIKRLDATGLNILPYASVSILTSTGSFATLREADGTPIGNPFDCDINGEREVWIMGGEYSASVAGGASWNFKLSGASDIQSVATIAGLKALTGMTDGQSFEVDGYLSGQLAGGGSFTWDASSTDTTNLATIFQADAGGTGRFLRKLTGGGLTIEMAGGLDDGTTDNKAAHETIRGLGSPVLMLGDGTYLFSAPPTVTSTTTTILSGSATLSGATATELKAQIIKDGQWAGIPFASAIRDKKIGIVCGTIRAHQPQSVTSITRSGTTATVTQTAHGYTTAQNIVIEGAAETDYNGYHSITVTGTDTFTYTVANSPATPATGTITSRNPAWWFYINDADHTPLGMVTTGSYDPITGGATTLTIAMDTTYTKVLSVVVCPDETLAAAQGLSIGPSVSLNGIALRMSCDRTFVSEIYYDGANWQTASSSGQDLLKSIAFASGNLTINHKYCPKLNIGLTGYNRSGAVTPYEPQLKSITNTSMVVNFLNQSTRTYVTTADTNMSLYATKNYNNLVPFDGSSDSWTIPFHFGNIWFLGIMQV